MLTNIAGIIADPLGYPCFRGDLVDTDPAAPGLQPNCQVSLVTNYAESTQTEQILPPCSTSVALNCWKLEADPLRCGESPGDLLLVVVRDTTLPDDNLTVVANCALQ